MDESNAEQDNKCITLEVAGGRVRYDTTERVLTSYADSMLGIMFGRRKDMLHAQDDGSFKIDYHCERFDWILDFHRNHNLKIFKERIASLNEEDRRQLLRDIRFFGLEEEVSYWINELAFQYGPDMMTARSWFATVLHGRNLFVFGGLSMEILNLETMEFSEGPSMLSERYGCAAVRLDESRILLVGGKLKTTEVFNTETMEFVPGPTLLMQRTYPAAVAIDEYRVLIVGGNWKPFATTEVLDIRTMTFSHGPSMLFPRLGCAAVKLDAQRILVVGGEPIPNRGESTTEILNIPLMTFERGPNMRFERKRAPSIVPLGSAHFLLVGGYGSDNRAAETTEILDVKTMTFEAGPLLRMGRVGCSAVKLDNRIIVLGGNKVFSFTEVLTINNE